MKANELRINNYLQDFGGNIAQVIYLTKDKIILESPIPLTEEWLLKFGFKRQINQPYADYILNDWGICYEIDTNNYFWYDYDKLEIKYVHQLQNIYFALTGDELEIKQK